MTKPKITSWCDVSKMDAAWECPECKTLHAFDCGSVLHEDVIYFTCETCEHEEIFRLKLKLKRVKAEELVEEAAVS